MKSVVELNKKNIIALVVLSLSVLISQGSYAALAPGQCAIGMGGLGGNQDETVNDVVVDRDLPVGGVITTTTVDAYRAGLVYCTTGTYSPYPINWTVNYHMIYNSGVKSSIADVYNTNLPGVGIKVTGLEDHPQNKYVFTNPTTSLRFVLESVDVRIAPAGESDNFQIDLIKTGPITPGALAGGKLIDNWVSGEDGYPVHGYITLMPSTITTGGCSVNTPTVNINMGEYFTSEFTDVGHKTSSVPVPISLECDAGAHISATITAEAETSQSGTLKLTSGTNTASGLGVQILDKNHTPVPLNQAFVVDTVSAQGEYDFNWSANYIQTSSTVTVGDANAMATVTLTYE